MNDILYDYALSGNCYKIRLLAALLNVSYELRAVDYYPGGAHRGPEFLAVNPAGTLPAYVHEGEIFTESAAILSLLAARYDASGQWLPVDDPARFARIQQWLAFSSRLTGTVGEARLHAMLGKPIDVEKALAGAKLALRELEAGLTAQRLRGMGFLAGEKPTIADIACFPYAALAPDAGIEHDAYPEIAAWTVRIRKLPGFLTMPGIHAAHESLESEGPAHG